MNATYLQHVNTTIQLATSSEPLADLAARSACRLENQSATKVIHQLEEALAQLPGGPTTERCKGKSIISMSMRHEWVIALDVDAANPLPAARWKPPADRTTAASNVPDSSGVKQAMKPFYVRRRSGATIVGTFSFPTLHSALHETDMRTAPPRIPVRTSHLIFPDKSVT
jgi:hypothetical protein